MQTLDTFNAHHVTVSLVAEDDGTYLVLWQSAVGSNRRGYTHLSEATGVFRHWCGLA